MANNSASSSERNNPKFLPCCDDVEICWVVVPDENLKPIFPILLEVIGVKQQVLHRAREMLKGIEAEEQRQNSL